MKIDLDLGSGHTAYRRASLIDLYLHTKFHRNRKNFLWTDGRTSETHFIRSTLHSRPNNWQNSTHTCELNFTDLLLPSVFVVRVLSVLWRRECQVRELRRRGSLLRLPTSQDELCTAAGTLSCTGCNKPLCHSHAQGRK